MAAGPTPGSWSTCRGCGRAVPASETACPTCGSTERVATGRIDELPARPRHRLRLAQGARVVIVVAVVVGLIAAIVPAVLSGPPVIPDPLTTSGTYTIPAGQFVYLSGAITGEDYVDGNYTILAPVGTQLIFQVYNSTGFPAFVHHEPATPQWNQTGPSSAPIVFAAPYTDTFYLVFENPYVPSSGITETVYIVTNYQTNVVIG